MTQTPTDTLPKLLQLRAEDSGDLEAVVDYRDAITYSQLNQRSAARANWLLSQGVNKGHRVGLLMANSVDWVVNACAIMRLGAALVPLSTLLRPAELRAQLATAGVRQLIATETFRGRDYRTDLNEIDRSSLPSLQHIYWQQGLADSTEERYRQVAHALEERVRPADDMVIIFTSGSNGAPKGVIHTHGGALRANAAGLTERCISKGERLYLPMPFFWVGGFAGGVISALNAGATLLTEAAPEPKRTLDFLARHRVTLFRGWPDQARQIAQLPDYSPAQLAGLKPGSLDALLPPDQQAPAGQRANLFGMTETFGPYCSFPLDQTLPEGKAGSCGKPLPGIELRIVDADSPAPESAKPLAAGSIGLIQVRSSNLMRGICGKEREDTFTADGWYSGGDLGWLDDDGFLYFAGRHDDMLKLNGVSVYPSEVTSVLEALPDIERAFVVPIDMDNKDGLGAALLPTEAEHFDLAGVQQACKSQLSAFKVPSHWKVLSSADELPLLSSGKVDRAALKQMLTD